MTLRRQTQRQGKLATRVVNVNDKHLALARIDDSLQFWVPNPRREDNTSTAPLTDVCLHGGSEISCSPMLDGHLKDTYI